MKTEFRALTAFLVMLGVVVALTVFSNEVQAAARPTANRIARTLFP